MRHQFMRFYTISKINEWNQCQLKYFAHHIEKENWIDDKSEGSLQLILGNLVHKFFENFYNKADTTLKFKHKIISLDNWKNLFKQAWEEEVEGRELIIKTESDIYLEKGLICLENFYKREHERDFKIPLFIEHKFTVNLGNFFKLNGKIDRIDQEADGSIVIIDYKITDKIKTFCEAERDTQLAAYAFACEQNILRKKPSYIGWYFPLKNINVFVEPQIEKQEELLSEILQIDSLIEKRNNDKNQYSSSPQTGYCDYCGYKHKCHEYNNEFFETNISEREILSLIEEATQIQAQLKPLEQRFEELKKQIKEFMLKKEINKLANVRLQKQDRGTYSVQALWSILQKLDNGYEFIKIHKSALDEALTSFSLSEQKLILNNYVSKQIAALKITS